VRSDIGPGRGGNGRWSQARGPHAHRPPPQHPPHRINARANIWALHSLGVHTILAPTGSLRPAIGVGSTDQVVDRTGRNDDTFHNDVHVCFADPFCVRARRAVVSTLRRNVWVVNDGGVMVAIRGPRFSTRAESRWYAGQGWDMISMTPYPEAALARKLDMSYICVALITDHDVIGDTPWPITQDLVREGLTPTPNDYARRCCR